MVNLEDLIGYCCLYCRACGIYQGKIREAVENLRKIIRTYGFHKVMPELARWEPAFQHYREFEEVLGGLVRFFGSCPGCRGGGGDPDCSVRDCCKGRGYTTCAECPEAEGCERLSRHERAVREMKGIRSMGLESWIEEMERKVRDGYFYLDERMRGQKGG